MTRLVRIGVVVGAALVFAACGGGNGKNDAGSAGGGAGGGAAGGGVGGGAGGGQGNCSPSCFTGQVCDPATNTCVECVSGFDCTDPAKPTCDTATHTCTSGAGGGSGGGAGGGAGGGGGGTPPSNDECNGAITLNFVNDTATASGDTTNATNSNATADTSPSCSASAHDSGGDVVYQYTLTTAKDVTITVTPTSTSQLEPALYVRSAANCSSGLDTNELACEVASNPDPATKKIYNQQPGTYSVWVDSRLDKPGAFDITATLSGPTLPPANDTCAMATPITITNNTGTANVDLSAATDDESGTCAQFASGGDVVYSVDVGSTPMNLTVTVGPNPSTGSADPVVYVKQGTCTGTEVACSDNGFSGDPETASVASATGVYYIFVKDYDPSTAGPVTVTVTLTTPAPGDSCNNPLSVDLSTATTQNISVDTTGFLGSYDSAQCNVAGNTGPEAVYAVTIPANRLLDVYAKPTKGADGGSTYDTLVYIRDTPCASGNEVSCADTYASGVAELSTVQNTDGGTYYVFVDGYANSSGIADVSFRSYAGAAVPANDLCRDDAGTLTATPLVLNTAATGSNNGALDQAWMACNGGGAEVFFSVTTAPTATQLTATVTATSTGFLPAVAIRTPGPTTSRVCEDSFSEPNIACVVSDGGSVATATAALDGGSSYIIVVEGANGTRGNFSVTAQAQ